MVWVNPQGGPGGGFGFGTQSAAGSRFVERMLSVIETARRAGRNVFAWLTDAVRAHFRREPAPSLLAAG